MQRNAGKCTVVTEPEVQIEGQISMGGEDIQRGRKEGYLSITATAAGKAEEKSIKRIRSATLTIQALRSRVIHSGLMD